MLNVGYLTMPNLSFVESTHLRSCCQILRSLLSRSDAVVGFCPPHSVSLSLYLFVFTFAADETLRQTKSEGSDVSPASDQLAEDKHGRRLGVVSEYISAATGRTSERYGSLLSGARQPNTLRWLNERAGQLRAGVSAARWPSAVITSAFFFPPLQMRVPLSEG